MEYTTQEMDELPIQRASNPFKIQGYLWRLADMSRPQRRRRQKNERGGALNAYLAMKSGRNVGRKLSGWLKRFKKKQRGGGMGKFSAAKAPLAATLGTGLHLGKFLGKSLLKLLGVQLKKKYKYR